MGSKNPDSGAVELVGVSKRFGDTVAVEELSVLIREGEFFTLVGPSGCGKTTTLRLIAGFESPTEGMVRFNGQDMAGVSPEDRNVGVVFQNYALFPHLSVYENIRYGLKFTSPPGGVSVEERVELLLDLIDLEGMEDREPSSLSGGQQQRVAIARALAPGPSVLLLDEPMSALDAQLREYLRVKVKQIQRELGITTIYVTHDQKEALAISDRVAVMHNGRVEQVGVPQEIYQRPRTRFVAEFIGDNNVFTGTVVGVESTGGCEVVDVDVGSGVFGVGVDATMREEVSVGDDVSFCVRPDSLVASTESNRFEATVESTEFLGGVTRTHLSWGEYSLVVRGSEMVRGCVRLGFSPWDAHLITDA